MIISHTLTNNQQTVKSLGFSYMAFPLSSSLYGPQIWQLLHPHFILLQTFFFFWFSLDLHSNNKCSNQKHRRHQILLLLLLLGLMDMRNSNKKLDRIVLVLGNQSFLSLCVMCLNIKKMNFCCCFVTRQLHAHTHKHTHQIPALLTK